MFSLADEAKMFFSRLESDLSLSGEWADDSSKRYRVPWADSLIASLSRTRATSSIFGTSYEYFITFQAERFGGCGQEEYWRAQAKTCELSWKGGFLRRGQPYFNPSLSAEIARKKFSLADDSLRKRLKEDERVGRLLRECDPVFCALLVYSDEIPAYPFSVGAAVLDYPYEISYDNKRDFFYVVRLEKKSGTHALKNPAKYLELLGLITAVI